jgi:Trypsin-co-occurring domain 2
LGIVAKTAKDPVRPKRKGEKMEGDDDSVGLAEALEYLRSELALAQERGSRAGIQFPIQSLTIELTVGLTKTRDGKAGFRVPYVGVELGGSMGMHHDTLQTITLQLAGPVDQEGRPIKVSEPSDTLDE